jgi:cytochrome c oxidase cbb3-type subunit III
MRTLFINKGMIKLAAFCFGAMAVPMNAWAAGPPQKSVLDNPLAVTLLIVIVALALAIGLLAYVVIGAAQVKVERYKKEKAATATKVAIMLIFCLISSAVFAQDGNAVSAAPEVVSNTINGLTKTSFYALVAVIGLELLIILSMLWFLRSLIAKEYAVVAAEKEAEVIKERSWKKWWLKLNSFRSMNEEQDIDLGHDYDNIRELDNKLPPWWLYGFYITIIFAGIYLWRYHVSHSAPLSVQEFEIAMSKAEEEKSDNLKKAGSSVDENTVKILTAAFDIDAGKKIFTTSCAPCHAADGGGIVGPNLTDDYWLHGGRVNDVFKTIKYGVPEKGMQPWKGTFSPTQIAQLASYIKSIHGTKVANPKEPQGEVYKEESAISDTTRIAAVK